MSEMKNALSNLEVYSSPRRGEIYVDYKGERILSIPNVPRKICKHDDLCYDLVMANYSDIVQDLIFAVEAD